MLGMVYAHSLSHRKNICLCQPQFVFATYRSRGLCTKVSEKSVSLTRLLSNTFCISSVQPQFVLLRQLGQESNAQPRVAQRVYAWCRSRHEKIHSHR